MCIQNGSYAHTSSLCLEASHTHTGIGLGDELSGAGPLSQELC